MEPAQKTARKKPKPAAKRPRGRQRTKTPKHWSKRMLRKIDQLAEAQCKDSTIAELLGVDDETFRKDLSKRTSKKRLQGKACILQTQYAAAQNVRRGTTDRIWWGKQHLDQSDKEKVEHSGGITLNDAAVVIGIMRGAKNAGSDGPTGSGE